LASRKVLSSPLNPGSAVPALAGEVAVEEDLYGGFVGNEDRRTLQRLRALSPEALAGRHPAFEDGRLDELLFRCRARNFPATLTDEERQRWQQHGAARLHRGAGGAMTLLQSLQAIDDLAESADDHDQGMLEALYDYGQEIAPEPGPVTGGMQR
jgi:exodeoxyribonuclease-1